MEAASLQQKKDHRQAGGPTGSDQEDQHTDLVQVWKPTDPRPAETLKDQRRPLRNRHSKTSSWSDRCVSDDIVLSRLLVSVFRRRVDSRYSQLIGCMSFGISSLFSSSEPVCGWYYLLAEEPPEGNITSVQTNEVPRGVVSWFWSDPVQSGLRKVRMFWKNTAWSWDDATGDDDDDGGCLLTVELRRTPDSAPDTNVNQINTTSSTAAVKTNLSTTTADLIDLTNHIRSTSCPFRLEPTNTNYSSYVSKLCTNQRLTVSVVRGKDGFGFTICSDSPVRVQAVDPVRSPTGRLGLAAEWTPRGNLEVCRPGPRHQTTGRKLLPHPAHSKHGRRRQGQLSGVRSSLGALGSLWRDRKEEEDQELTDCPPNTTTLKGTRVTSSNGDNYIILSPVDPGGQLLQPVYHNGNGTIGHLYQTHPSRGQNLFQDPRPSASQRPFTSHTATMPLPPPSTSSSSTLSGNYGNYQNCTIVQSHLPCSNYGTYVTPAPKTLIFPIFVQPLDLCSSERSLLLSEEMFLHQADLLPAKLHNKYTVNIKMCMCVCVCQVTVLIYTDLLLLTREDEVGRCNVLQSPLYLNSLQLREVSSEPLHIYLLQSSHSCCRCLFSLEAFNIEQKVRVSLCLHDNIHQQLVTTKSGHSQQGEGESASETSEGMACVGGRGLLLSPAHFIMKEEDSDEEEEKEGGAEFSSSCKAAVLRRSLSEGSLLQELHSPRFLSDSTIHRLTRPATFDPDAGPAPCPPSPHTLRKQLTREGGSLHHMLLLLNGSKVKAADVRSRLAFLPQWENSNYGNSLEKALRNNRSEFSEENLDFWLAVEKFRRTRPLNKMAARAAKIYDEFISTTAARQVNVDSSVRESTNHSLCLCISPTSFQVAQQQVFGLMEMDSYPRFLKSRLYTQLANQGTPTVQGLANQSGAVSTEPAI
ncbi:hypothetical protein PAMP_021664 [Pampus punctatissimus]